MAQEFRAEIDAIVQFTNGGSLTVNCFRVDVPDPDVDEATVGELLVTSLGLLMAGPIEVQAFRVLEEAHKDTRDAPSDPARVAAGAQGRAAAYVDLTHPIVAGMVTYPGLPGPEITPHLTREASRERYAAGTEFAIDRISMVGNTGTYLDSPFHRYADGVDLAGIPLSSFVDLPVTLVRTLGAAEPAVDVGTLAAHDVSGRAVLLHTGGDVGWGTDAYAVDPPYLTERAAQWLVDHGAALVGIDSVNIDSMAGGTRPAHTLLLGAGIPVVEHLTNLGQVPVRGARFFAAPPPVRGFGTFPVRAFVTVPGL